MGKLNVIIPDDLDRRFREEVMRRIGWKKGALQQAVIEALELWIEKGRSTP
ncbi:MAG: hypothetical protein QW341_01935 [Candidatus Bathyarchaeia archaeon]